MSNDQPPVNGEPQPNTGAQPQPIPAGWYADPSSQRTRWWDGRAWTENFHTPATAAAGPNGIAVAALVLGIAGFVFMAIPFFIGWFLGGIPDIIAVVLGIVGLAGGRLNSSGKVMAIVGLCLGAVSLLSVFIGAGSIW